MYFKLVGWFSGLFCVGVLLTLTLKKFVLFLNMFFWDVLKGNGMYGAFESV